MPIASVKSSGVTEIDVMVGAVTVIEVDLETLPIVAVMVAVPAATPLTRPAASMVALAMVEEDQTTRLVRSRLLPSLKLPVAVSCCVVLIGIEGLAGEMAIEVRLGLAPPVTVMAAELVKAPDLTVIVAAPLATPVTTPAVLTVAIFESEEVQVAEELRSLVVPSE